MTSALEKPGIFYIVTWELRRIHGSLRKGGKSLLTKFQDIVEKDE